MNHRRQTWPGRHKALDESMRMYQHRSYTLHLLDKRHFDALNHQNHVSYLNGYCLDAMCEIPAGACYQAAQLMTQRNIIRGVTLAELQEREALAERLINEL